MDADDSAICGDIMVGNYNPNSFEKIVGDVEPHCDDFSGKRTPVGDGVIDGSDCVTIMRDVEGYEELAWPYRGKLSFLVDDARVMGLGLQVLFPGGVDIDALVFDSTCDGAIGDDGWIIGVGERGSGGCIVAAGECTGQAMVAFGYRSFDQLPDYILEQGYCDDGFSPLPDCGSRLEQASGVVPRPCTPRR